MRSKNTRRWISIPEPVSYTHLIIGEIGEIFTFGSHTVKVADRESEMVFTDGLNLAAEFRAVGAGGGRTLFAYLAGASVHSGCLPGNSFGIVGQIIVGGGSRSADFQFQSYLLSLIHIWRQSRSIRVRSETMRIFRGRELTISPEIRQ